MPNSSPSSARPSVTPGIQIRAMNISDGSPPFLCKTNLRIVPPQDFSSISTTLIQAINAQALSENSSRVGDISIFIHWAGETPDKYAYQTASRCWNNISLDLMLLSKKEFSTDSPDELKGLWIFLARRKYRDEIFCVFETSPTPPPDCTSEPENDIERDIDYSLWLWKRKSLRYVDVGQCPLTWWSLFQTGCFSIRKPRLKAMPGITDHAFIYRTLDKSSSSTPTFWSFKYKCIFKSICEIHLWSNLYLWFITGSTKPLTRNSLLKSLLIPSLASSALWLSRSNPENLSSPQHTIF